MKLWIARDSNGSLWLHKKRPRYQGGDCVAWWFSGDGFEIGKNLLPEVTFENSPQEVELKLIEKCVSK